MSGWVWYRKGWQPPDPIVQRLAEHCMTEEACKLDPEQRSLAEKTVAEHCGIRTWKLHAVNCRSTHLHVVVTADRHPDDVREQFKAWCTRKLKELERARRVGTNPTRQRVRQQWWAERGSKRFIGDEDSLEAAILYVRNAQDRER